MIGHIHPKLRELQKGAKEEEGWNSFWGPSSDQLLIMRRRMKQVKCKAYQKLVSREDRPDKRYYWQKLHEIWLHRCYTNRSFSFELSPHQLLCMLYIGNKCKILKLIFNKPWWAILKREPGHLICVPTVVYRRRWQTLDDVQRKFLQFITFIKLKTPNIKKTHQTSFIFSLTLQNMNITMHCFGRKENLMQ